MKSLYYFYFYSLRIFIYFFLKEFYNTRSIFSNTFKSENKWPNLLPLQYEKYLPYRLTLRSCTKNAKIVDIDWRSIDRVEVNLPFFFCLQNVFDPWRYKLLFLTKPGNKTSKKIMEKQKIHQVKKILRISQQKNDKIKLENL